MCPSTYFFSSLASSPHVCDELIPSHLSPPLARYATTIHAINSAIVKLSQLTVATPVFRGLAGLRLPEYFFVKNKDNIAGGVEYGFSSTTRNRGTANFYAKVKEHDVASTILETRMGMTDRGADVGFLSQFPHEEEILFAPLTGMEVESTSIAGDVLVVKAKLTVNMASLTLEQVSSKSTAI